MAARKDKSIAYEEDHAMSSRSILLVDTAFSALPIYNSIKNECDDVWVIGKRPTDVLAQLAGNNWLYGDYSRVEFVKEQIDRNKFTHIIPGCTDVSIEICSLVGLNTFIDTAHNVSILNDKIKFRQLCSTLGLPSPKIMAIDELVQGEKYIIKPSSSYSGKGISIVNFVNGDNLEKVLLKANAESALGTNLIEEFIEGQLFSFSAFLERDKVIDYFVVKEGSSSNPFAVDTSFVQHDPCNHIIKILVDGVESISGHLNLKDGLFHLQYIVRNGMPFFIEATRRCPGDLYSLLIFFSTGFDYSAKYASYFLGQHFEAKKIKREFIIRHTISSLMNGINCGINMKYTAPLRAIYPLSELGGRILGRQRSRFGIIFTDESDAYMRDLSYEKFLSRQVYDVGDCFLLGDE